MATKILVSLDETLLRRVDQVARARGLSRSAYLSGLAAQDLELAHGPGRHPVARAALEELDELFREAPPGEATTEVRQEREARA